MNDRPDSSDNAPATFRCTLFVAGRERNSELARRNLRAFCESDLCGRCEIRIVDVLEDAMLGAQYGIVVTPALLIHQPEPMQIIIGNLRDVQRLRGAFGVAL